MEGAGPGPRCGACGAGPLVPRRRHRWRAWAVVVGYTLLVPALPCLPLAAAAFFYFLWESRLSSEDTIRLMREASVPASLIEGGTRAMYLSDEQRAELTLRQRWAYDLARRRHEPPYWGGPDWVALEAAMLFGAALVAAIVGALLVRKKVVLLCGACGKGTTAS